MSEVTHAEYCRAWRASKRKVASPPPIRTQIPTPPGCCDFCKTKLGKVVYLTPKPRQRAHRICFDLLMEKRNVAVVPR